MKYRKALKILKKEKGLVFDSDDVYHVSERLELCDIFLPVTIKNRIEILLWIVSLTKEEDYKLPSRKYKKVYIHRTRYKYKNKKQKNFFMSKRWKNLRQVVINNYGKRCMRCGVLGGPCHIDHIFPRSRYPNLEFDFDNLQVLCNDCNMKKSNKFYCDFRKISDEEKMIIIRKANCFSLNITKIHSMDG
jgi:5-methylcytosine-specific restriction endonuclease McrA